MLPDGPLFFRRRLPHWRVDAATYFVTWRLQRTQSDLTPDERTLVVAALGHGDRLRYRLIAYVTMNDHVHVVVRPLDGFKLSNILHSWKSFTANKLQRVHGRQGRIWQDESYDRVVRDEQELVQEINYILNNPGRRWSECGNYPWVGCRGLE